MKLNLLSNLMQLLSIMNPKSVPLVVIIGATGCSKTRLSLELAKRFDGEIISADSMQVYKGLDIITNKATPEERQLIPHHLIDFLEPTKRFTVYDFSQMALQLIDDLKARGKLPILVGGTNYYIESILWKILIKDPNKVEDKHLVFDREMLEFTETEFTDSELTKDNIFSKPILSESFRNNSSLRLHKILEEVDPISAQIIHRNNRRKIIRSLQVYQQNNRTQSEIIEEQKTTEGGSELGGPLRFTDAIILWLDCHKDVLDKRLDERVEQMIKRGLIDELLGFHFEYNKRRISENTLADYSKGIFQSIGFKEFHNYLILSEEQRKSSFAEPLLRQGIDSLKLVTKRYANSQLKWIRNRFLKHNDRVVPNIYRLDTTSPELWQQNVLQPSIDLISAQLNGRPSPNHIKSEPKINVAKDNAKLFPCDVCKKQISGLVAYESHLKSKGHKYHLNRQKNLRKQQLYRLLAILKSHESSLKERRRNSF